MGCEHRKEWTWAMQFMDGIQKPAQFTALGWHYRGYHTYKVCNECREKYHAGDDIIITHGKEWFVCNKALGVHKSPF